MKKCYLSEQFFIELSKSPGSTRLTIIISPTKRTILHKIGFKGHVVRVAEKKTTYYCRSASIVSSAIVGCAKKNSLKEILFLGMSKGGYAALLYGIRCAEKYSDINIYSLAFNPQTRIYPFNPRLPYPSYMRLMTDVKNDKALENDLETHGDVSKLKLPANLSSRVVFCAGNSVDAAEVAALTDSSYQIVPLPFNFHASLIPFIAKNLDEEEIKRHMAAIYRDADDDGLATLPKNPTELEYAIKSASVPSLVEFIEEFINSKS